MLGLFLSILLSIYHPPVSYDISLAGNFGEPRPHHFHGGIDIKTDGVEGKAIYAIGDGYVSRVTMGSSEGILATYQGCLAPLSVST